MALDDSDAMKMYVREVSAIPPLTKEEEARLFQEMKELGKRGEIAERQLLESRLHLVLPIADKYASRGISMLELIQEGNLGLMQALKECRNVQVDDFSAFATSHIEGAISAAIAKTRPQ